MDSGYIDINKRLIDKCRQGDSKAQFEVYKLYYKAMYNVCLRFVRDAMTAEDIMQESFLSAFRNIDTFRGEVSFGAWLKRIVINRSLDVLKKRSIDTEELEEGRTVIDDDSYGSDEVEYKIEKVKRAINLMPNNQRILLTLYLIEGYDHEEISQILNMSHNAVRTGYSRAKKQLQELTLAIGNVIKNRYTFFNTLRKNNMLDEKNNPLMWKRKETGKTFMEDMIQQDEELKRTVSDIRFGAQSIIRSGIWNPSYDMYDNQYIYSENVMQEDMKVAKEQVEKIRAFDEKLQNGTYKQNDIEPTQKRKFTLNKETKKKAINSSKIKTDMSDILSSEISKSTEISDSPKITELIHTIEPISTKISNEIIECG